MPASPVFNLDDSPELIRALVHNLQARPEFTHLVLVLGRSECGALEATTDELMPQVVRANMITSVNYLRQGFQAYRTHDGRGGRMVVGAEYALKTGVVEFFDGLLE